MSNKSYANDIKIDTSLIPDHVRYSLSLATLEFTKRLMVNPITHKTLEEKKKELKLK